MSTIDPGMEDQLANKAEKVDQSDDSDEINDEQEFGSGEEQEELVDPSRYWLMSTAIPLIAGTFGPIANSFSILALVYEWRKYIPPGSSSSLGITMKDPHWLIAVNAVSLVAALIANASLLLNMTKRIRFSIAQPVTVAGFFISSLLLIGDIAGMVASPTYWITYEPAIPNDRHALTSAYYYAIFAAGIYMIIAILMCFTIWGAEKGLYKKDFVLTNSQRTLMLQTMSFMAYLLLGALVFSKVEGWEYLEAVYWADTTVLTIGLGDYSPETHTGRSLLFPFAVGGILTVGLVVGSIRTLVLERGKEKMSARITEKKRSNAINHIDEKHQTIRISWFSRAEFRTDSNMTAAHRRKEEFDAMRKVQKAAERERRWMALTLSGIVAFILWLVGAAIFYVCERSQKWTYFESLYFAFTSLLTIGYGDFTPASNSGKPFFVLWSLLSVPSLTILISNMGDTVVKWFSDITMYIGAVTVLPGEKGFRAGMKHVVNRARPKEWEAKGFVPPGIFGDIRRGDGEDSPRNVHHHNTLTERQLLDRLAHRLSNHIDHLDELPPSATEEERLHHDIAFYNYVLSRECRNVQQHMSDSPPKKYEWEEWEYYLRLIGNDEDNDPEDFPDQKFADILVPGPLRVSHTMMQMAGTSANGTPANGTPARTPATETPPDVKGEADRPPANETSANATPANATPAIETPPDRTQEADRSPAAQPAVDKKHHKKPKPTPKPKEFSWLSPESPLMGLKTEPEWILERLSAALEREMDRQRKGYRRKPTISMTEMHEHLVRVKREQMEADEEEARQKKEEEDV